MPTTRLTHWSALSPYGPTSAHFHTGVTAAATAAGGVPDFEIRTALGRSGTRSMDRVTALAVAAIGDLIAQPGATGLVDSRTAIVLGTTAGSVASTMRFTRDSLTEDRPYLVDPARFPNTVMNCAAGRSAIWHKLRGPNATVAGGRAAGLMAVNYARRLLATGRADTVVVGAAEELSSERSRIDPHTDGSTGAPLSEGAGVFLMHRAEDTDATTGLELIGPVYTRMVPEADAGAVAIEEATRALTRANLDPASVQSIAITGPLDLGDRAIEAFPDAGAVLRPEDRIGDTGAAASIFALALLAQGHDTPVPGMLRPDTSVSGVPRPDASVPGMPRPNISVPSMLSPKTSVPGMLSPNISVPGMLLAGIALVFAYDEHNLVTAVVRVHGGFQ
ncbi:3-oxoacyl-ACP synthase [Nocardia terpenica]|uniref:beta-ketoacyl synthase N-terminal-like domain-containing protein n=1 Tax=Nocardia terpenica TaxID=455432 RepID=UPI002FE3AD7A